MSDQLAPAVYSRSRRACIPEAFEIFLDHLLRMNLLFLLKSFLLRKPSVTCLLMDDFFCRSNEKIAVNFDFLKLAGN
ncbi:hypothetical protein ACH3XW_32915 [Acanthocheilonema viteae]